MLVELDKIKIHDRIRKDFGNVDELAEDIGKDEETYEEFFGG